MCVGLLENNCSCIQLNNTFLCTLPCNRLWLNDLTAFWNVIIVSEPVARQTAQKRAIELDARTVVF